MSISAHKNIYEHISDENMREHNSSWNYIWEYKVMEVHRGISAHEKPNEHMRGILVHTSISAHEYLEAYQPMKIDENSAQATLKYVWDIANETTYENIAQGST